MKHFILLPLPSTPSVFPSIFCPKTACRVPKRFNGLSINGRAANSFVEHFQTPIRRKLLNPMFTPNIREGRGGPYRR